MMSSFIRIRGKKKIDTVANYLKKIQCICNMTPFNLRDYSYFLLTKKKKQIIIIGHNIHLTKTKMYCALVELLKSL